MNTTPSENETQGAGTTKKLIREAEDRELTGSNAADVIVTVSLIFCEYLVQPPSSPHKPCRVVMNYIGGPEIRLEGRPHDFLKLRDLLTEYFEEAEHAS